MRHLTRPVSFVGLISFTILASACGASVTDASQSTSAAAPALSSDAGSDQKTLVVKDGEVLVLGWKELGVAPTCGEELDFFTNQARRLASLWSCAGSDAGP